ncbi:hypothetical protein JYU34_017401 [Plutella xylostella]|uniref:Uncharacterized protein n=1 Tax=Plutella xylostella TaxID=51655 RepID=A0ABQ7Q132_PLUXY|nr:hypothetical protein JYU34_017401 [Plutella xylostella]
MRHCDCRGVTRWRRPAGEGGGGRGARGGPSVPPECNTDPTWTAHIAHSLPTYVPSRLIRTYD